MSNIDNQIKALMLKKKKIDYVSYVADLVKNDTKCVDFKDVQKEIVEKIEPFLLQLMEAIEKDSALATAETAETFTKNEANILKVLAARAATKPLPPAPPVNNGGFTPEVPPPPAQSTSSVKDKMNFAMSNRHLGNKRVQVLNDQNAQIFGTVVGLDAPFVLVKTDTGPTINVPLEKIVPV